MPSTVRLPGIGFQTEPPAEQPLLPRMDIAAFVGFAASGPLDIPVPVEDMGRFHDLFGVDLQLGWDDAQGGWSYAHMAPAVRAFFRNGGRRCWVVRVAGTAATNQFVVPGLLRLSTRPAQPDVLEAAWVSARSPGSWSDDLSVNAQVQTDSLGTAAVTAVAGGFQFGITAAANAPVAGDMVRIDEANGVAGFLSVTWSARGVFRTGSGYWFQQLTDGSALGALVEARALHAGSNETVLSGVTWQPGTGEFVLRVPQAAIAEITPGMWLRLRLAGGTVMMLVEELRPDPVQPDFALAYSGRAWLWLAGAPAFPAEFTVSKVRLELMARRHGGEIARLGTIGLIPGGARYLGYLPDDEQLFRPADKPDRPPGKDLRDDASVPRFPLASSESALCLPLGVETFADVAFDQPRDPAPGTPLERDGLRAFHASLFVDPDLAGRTVLSLIQEANAKQFGLRGTAQTPLIGMHALIRVEEASLMAIPDAVHLGWTLESQQWSDIPAPVFTAEELRSDGGFRLAWTTIGIADSYEVASSQNPQFATSTQTFSGLATETIIGVAAPCIGELYYRVRALAGNRVSPWSAAAIREVASFPFDECQRTVIPAPVLTTAMLGAGRLQLNWTLSVPGAFSFLLESGADPEFLTAQTIWKGSDTTFSLINPTAAYFRVSAVRDDRTAGPWSNAVSTQADGGAMWKTAADPVDQDSIAPAGELLEIHRELITLCAARGDMMAVLAAPRYFRETAALEYRRALAAAAGDDEEGRISSFAALYQPWIYFRDADGSPDRAVRLIPADGAATGVLAARARTRGAWISPGNQPIRDVVALDLDVEGSTAALLFSEQINLIRRHARGFLALSAETLSSSTQLRGINVRLLLILLRRLALRDGMKHVFQPNDEVLQRSVQRTFEEVLSSLFTRGAFSGATPAESYRVVTDESLNTQQSIDRGRFIVALKVAPSQPLTFLTVRLVQHGAETFTAEEA